MAITAYIGVPGSYKTHDAVRRIIEYMIEAKFRSHNPDMKAENYPSYSKMLSMIVKYNEADIVPPAPLRHVYTNIRGFGKDEYRIVLKAITGWLERDCVDYLHSLSDHEMKTHFGTIDTDKYLVDTDPPEENPNYNLVKDCKFQRNSVVAVDECHTLFNCRDYNLASNRAFTYYGTYHRHDNSHMLLISHLMTKVDKQMLDLIGISYVFEQILFMGKAGRSKYVRHMYRGDDVSGKAVHNQTLSIHNGTINSYMTTKSGDVDSVDFIKTPNMLLRSPVLWALPFMLLATCFCFYKASRGNGIMGNLMHSDKSVIKGPPAKVLSRGSVAPVAPLPALASLAPPIPVMPVQRSYSSPVAEAPVAAANGRKVVGDINIGGEYYLLLADGSFERGSLSKHKQFTVKMGVENNVTNYTDSHGIIGPVPVGGSGTGGFPVSPLGGPVKKLGGVVGGSRKS